MFGPIFVRLCASWLLLAGLTWPVPAAAGPTPATTPIPPSWSSFTSMGSTLLVGNPSCHQFNTPSQEAAGKQPQAVRRPRGILYRGLCAGVGTNGKILFNLFSTYAFPGGTWSGWQAVSGVSTLASDPGCAGPNYWDEAHWLFSVCAARTTGGRMAVYLYDGGGFEGELLLPAMIASTPSCATDLSYNPVSGYPYPGSVDTGWTVVCVARTANGALALAQYNYGYVDSAGGSIRQAPWRTGSWSVSVTLPSNGPAYSPPSCVEFDNTGGWCAWLTPGNQMSGAFIVPKNQKNYTDPDYEWGPAANLGGTLTHPPNCEFYYGALSGAGVTCFGTGENSNLYGNVYFVNPTLSPPKYQWTGWLGRIGGLVNGYSCVNAGDGNAIACGVTGLSNSGFYTNAFNSYNWQGWQQQGSGVYVGTPSCFEMSLAIVICSVHKADGTAASITGFNPASF